VGNAWTAVAAVVALDRAGKGIRTAPRDALISLNSPPEELGRAFGVHRSLDAAGAMLGPLFAFLLLSWMPLRFDVIFVVSFAVAVIGVGVITLFVRSDQSAESSSSSSANAEPSMRDALVVWKGTAFRPLLIATSILSLATVSDSFVFLSLQRQADFSAGLFPLLFVGVSLATFALAVPAGRLADRRGRLAVFLGGHMLLLAVYLVLLVPQSGVVRLAICLALLGAYYAATDGVLPAIAAGMLPRELCGSGLAWLATATNLGRLFSSLLFGLLWNALGHVTAMLAFAAALLAAVITTVVLLREQLKHAPTPVA
jgi:MFS family permease